MASMTTFKSLKSFYIQSYLSQELCNVAISILESLVLEELNSKKGIQISLDKPLGCKKTMTNMERPAVLRQYYGLTISKGVRFCYGNGTGSKTVGKLITRAMTKNMKLLAVAIKNNLEFIPKCKRSFINLSFNHCTILFYYHKTPNSSKKMLGLHTDNIYSKKNGKYLCNKNSQTESTPTCIVTIGGSREICFEKQCLLVKKNKKKSKWCEKAISKQTIKLRHNSLFVLHPKDEIPSEENGVTVRWRHGVSNYAKTNEVSMALVFRTVKNTTSVQNNIPKKVHLSMNQENVTHKSHQRLQHLFQEYFMKGVHYN